MDLLGLLVDLLGLRVDLLGLRVDLLGLRVDLLCLLVDHCRLGLEPLLAFSLESIVFINELPVH